MKYNIEQFRTTLLTDKVNNYWQRFTEDEWTDILHIAAEKIFNESYEAELWEANNDAYQEGYDEGYYEGQDHGYELGRSDGYDDGYAHGLAEGTERGKEDV